jgi:hypothetical protein
MEKRLPYEKPELRKVRLDVKTSVLSVCRTSITVTGDESLGTCEIVGVCWATSME